MPCLTCHCAAVADSAAYCMAVDEPDGTPCTDADASIGNGACSLGACVASDGGGVSGSGGSTGAGGTGIDGG